MRKNFIIPLQKGDNEIPYRFLVTSQTPNSLLPELRKKYTDEGQHIGFFLISSSAYQAFMQRYDPPKKLFMMILLLLKKGIQKQLPKLAKP